MKIDILTIFPAMFEGPLTESLIGKARDKGIVSIGIHDIRSFTTDRHRSVDDRPFGGGPGMVMKPDPLYRALKSVGARMTNRKKRSASDPLVIYLSPQGAPLTQALVTELSSAKHLVLLCGHYEGIDERVMHWVDREISIGDYVLTGGELPAMVLTDAVVRQLPGTVKESESIRRDSFYNGLLDYPHYTRPAKFMRKTIPAELLSGNHAFVERWRNEQSLLRTFLKRPDLLEKISLSAEERKTLDALISSKDTKHRRTKRQQR